MHNCIILYISFINEPNIAHAGYRKAWPTLLFVDALL